MKPFTFTLSKINIKKNVFWVAIVILAIGAIGGALWLGKTSNFNWENLAAKFAFNLPKEEKKVQEEIPMEELKLTFPDLNKNYEETAEKGEGITHLARKALKKYLSERSVNFEVTSEHKIYIEDYLQKKTGNHWLKIGDKISFSEQLIKEAVDASKNLTPTQLDNLKQFSSQVNFS